MPLRTFSALSLAVGLCFASVAGAAPKVPSAPVTQHQKPAPHGKVKIAHRPKLRVQPREPNKLVRRGPLKVKLPQRHLTLNKRSMAIRR
ncbi:MAG: hypothetical protein JST54_31745 [Deltaproteobacteria bacterium]|nr:hypothetical protein [Deltaproteobacteria bacterium]